jgi:Tetracyclin repressor-like, C-terminal domain
VVKTDRRSSSACFAALAQNAALIEPMRAAYAELHRRIAEEGLPPGVGEAVAAAIDGLWLYWVLGLAEVDQALVVRVRTALEAMLERSLCPRDGPADGTAAEP